MHAAGIICGASTIHWIARLAYLVCPTPSIPISSPMRIPSLEMADRFMSCLFLLLLLAALFPRTALGQDRNPRYGIGFSVLAAEQDGVGLGLRGRAAFPLNSNLSLAADIGITGFIFGGRDDAEYAFDPQLSFIVTLPGRDRAPYVMAGVGAYVSTGDAEGGPFFHFGIGRAQLLGETSVFYEIDPAIVIEQNGVNFNLPLRFGIIF